MWTRTNPRRSKQLLRMSKIWGNGRNLCWNIPRRTTIRNIYSITSLQALLCLVLLTLLLYCIYNFEKLNLFHKQDPVTKKMHMLNLKFNLRKDWKPSWTLILMSFKMMRASKRNDERRICRLRKLEIKRSFHQKRNQENAILILFLFWPLITRQCGLQSTTEPLYIWMKMTKTKLVKR